MISPRLFPRAVYPHCCGAHDTTQALGSAPPASQRKAKKVGAKADMCKTPSARSFDDWLVKQWLPYVLLSNSKTLAETPKYVIKYEVSVCIFSCTTALCTRLPQKCDFCCVGFLDVRVLGFVFDRLLSSSECFTIFVMPTLGLCACVRWNFARVSFQGRTRKLWLEKYTWRVEELV